MALHVAPWRLGPAQKVTATSVATTSTAVGSQTRALLLTVETQNVRVAVGGGEATPTSTLLKTTDDPLVVGCGPGDTVSVIMDALSGGVLGITELTH